MTRPNDLYDLIANTTDPVMMRGVIITQRRLEFVNQFINRARRHFHQPGDTDQQTDRRLAEALGWADSIAGHLDLELPLTIQPLTDAEVETRFRREYPAPTAPQH